MAVVPWGTQVITRRQFGAGSFAGGTWTPGTATDTTVSDVRWVPASERTIERLPEGARARDPRLVFTRSELRTAEQGEREADRVQFADSDDWYEVSSVKDFSDAPFLAHYEAVVLRCKEAG